MEKKTAFIIFLVIVIIILIGTIFYFVALPKYNQSFYNQGYSDGSYNVIYSINQNGLIPVIQNVSGNMTIKNIDIKTICDNLGLK